jgi:hypothetical protein
MQRRRRLDRQRRCADHELLDHHLLLLDDDGIHDHEHDGRRR